MTLVVKTVAQYQNEISFEKYNDYSKLQFKLGTTVPEPTVTEYVVNMYYNREDLIENGISQEFIQSLEINDGKRIVKVFTSTTNTYKSEYQKMFGDQNEYYVIKNGNEIIGCLLLNDIPRRERSKFIDDFIKKYYNKDQIPERDPKYVKFFKPAHVSNPKSMLSYQDRKLYIPNKIEHLDLHSTNFANTIFNLDDLPITCRFVNFEKSGYTNIIGTVRESLTICIKGAEYLIEAPEGCNAGQYIPDTCHFDNNDIFIRSDSCQRKYISNNNKYKIFKSYKYSEVINSLDLKNINEPIDFLPAGLEELEIRNNKYNYSFIVTCKYLKKLEFRFSIVDGIDINTCKDTIEYIDISDTNIKSIDVTNCKRLKYLSIIYTDIDSIDLANCDSLKMIKCKDTTTILNKPDNVEVSFYKYD